MYNAVCLQEEYLAALNKQEIAKRDVDGVTNQIEQVKEEISELGKEVALLNKVYDDQDELLSKCTVIYKDFPAQQDLWRVCWATPWITKFQKTGQLKNIYMEQLSCSVSTL